MLSHQHWLSRRLPLWVTSILLRSQTWSDISTQRYYDGLKGACGCGSASGNSAFLWQVSIQDTCVRPAPSSFLQPPAVFVALYTTSWLAHQSGISSGLYTAAASQALYDSSGLSWCGTGCGKCYQLTSTGNSPCSSCGTGGASGKSIIVMVTNLCPNNGNAQWCPTVGGTNQYGYSYHFDIMAQSEVLGDNPVVDFEEVTCPGTMTSDYSQCQCATLT